MVSELRLRVMLGTSGGVLPLAALAAWLGGAHAGLGVLAAGALTIGNFLWLVRDLPSAGRQPNDPRPVLGWAFSAVARFALLAALVATLLVTGWAHPLALVGGLTVLPCALVAAGLRTARRRAEDR